jgi:DNA-binding transcriptional ArsR family regulator
VTAEGSAQPALHVPAAGGNTARPARPAAAGNTARPARPAAAEDPGQTARPAAAEDPGQTARSAAAEDPGQTAGPAGAVGGETSQTLGRGLRLLQLVAASAEAVTVTEVAARLGTSRTAVYRLLATLEMFGLVERGHDGRLRLGLGLLPLAAAVQPRLRQAALPALRRLAEELGATSHLTIADGDEAVAIAVVEPSWTEVHVAYRVGSRHPLARGAAGRAILEARAGRPAFVITEGELQAGASGVAAPVLGVAGLEASVGVVALGRSGLSGTDTGTAQPAGLDPAVVGPRVVAAAAAVAAALGYR